MLTPKTPRPTTHIPITVPEKNAILRPEFRLSLQAFAVLAFEAVATLIPMFPARADKKAPIIKVIDI